MLAAAFVLVGLALVAVVAAVATGRLTPTPLAPAVHTVPRVGLPEHLSAADVAELPLPGAVLGYDRDQVDQELRQARDVLAEQERDLAALGLEVPASGPDDGAITAPDGPAPDGTPEGHA